MSRLNLRSFDGATGEGTYDFIAQNEPWAQNAKHSSLLQILMTFVTGAISRDILVSRQHPQHLQPTAPSASPVGLAMGFAGKNVPKSLIWLEEQGSPPGKLKDVRMTPALRGPTAVTWLTVYGGL